MLRDNLIGFHVFTKHFIPWQLFGEHINERSVLYVGAKSVDFINSSVKNESWNQIMAMDMTFIGRFIDHSQHALTAPPPPSPTHSQPNKYHCSVLSKMKWNESGFRPPLCTYRLKPKLGLRTEPWTLAWKAAVLTTTLGPPPSVLSRHVVDWYCIWTLNFLNYAVLL